MHSSMEKGDAARTRLASFVARARLLRGYGACEAECSPSEREEFLSLLRAFRPFLQKAEPLYVPSIFALCDRWLGPGTLTDELHRIHERWSQAMNGSLLSLAIEGDASRGEARLDDWIKRRYFEAGSEKLDRMEDLASAAGVEVRPQLKARVREAVAVTLHLADVIERSGNAGAFSFRTRAARPAAPGPWMYRDSR